MENFSFIHKKNNLVELPKDYERDESTITGMYLTNSIRFYKNKFDEETINFDEKYTREKIRRYIRILHASMADFKIIDNRISLTGTGTNQEKDYNYKNGIIIVKCDKYMDIVEKDSISDYLESYGFDKAKANEVLSNEETILNRVKGKKLKYTLNH